MKEQEHMSILFIFFKSDRQRSLAFLEFVYYRIVQYRVMFVDHHQLRN